MTVISGEEDFRRSNGMYSDFPAYYLSSQGGDGGFFHDIGLISPLPREFQVIQDSPVPLLQNCDEANKDFVILAEFSELEGPIPLCTIPTNAPDKTDVTLNNFAVHLMSTDYQVNLIGQFKICEDTQVLRKNVFKGVHVFMQYFTLYDIKARGFVRPFCFGYVSKDHVKLDRILEQLIAKFDKMTKVLKQANRKWFAEELSQYLAKLSKAKESFIQTKQNSVDVGVDDESETIFSFESQINGSSNGVGCYDSDTITLDQIAHQYSEIQNILRTVQAANNIELEQELYNLSKLLVEMQQTSSSSPLQTLLKTLNSLRIGYLPDAVQDSIEPLNIPLLHPLKVKGESLRPLTTLGQLGTLQLVWRLLQLYNEHKEDLIFMDMAQLTLDFRIHCSVVTQGRSVGVGAKLPVPNNDDDNNAYLKEEEEERRLLLDPEVSSVLDKVHAAVPVPVPSDSKSGSYHTISEEESEVLHHSPPQEDETTVINKSTLPPVSNSNSSTTSPTKSSDFTILSQPSSSYSTPHSSLGTSSPPLTGTLATRPSMSSSSFTSNEDDYWQHHPPSSATPTSTTEQTIPKRSWFSYASSSISSRSSPGYGLLGFFRHYNKIAHHVLYSILLGRPIIICGREEHRSKVERAVNALIPLIPSLESWKLMKFHRGILIQDHLSQFKLIGLCIPERLQVQDLIHPRDENYVTIVNVEKKMLLGPAYSGSGEFLRSFGAENLVQKNFLGKSDLALLSYIGGIYAEIETKVYLYKALEEKAGRKSGTHNNIKVNVKGLGLKGSDLDIVKHLASLIPNPDRSVDIF